MKKNTRKALVLLPGGEGHRETLVRLLGTEWEIVFLPDKCPGKALIDAIEDAEVILGDPPPELLDRARSLRFLQTTWAGIERYLKVYPKEGGYQLCNMSGAYGPAIAEHMMAMALTLFRQFPAYLTQMESGRWESLGSEKPLEGALALVLGAGDIGTSFAWRLAPFGAAIVGVRRTARPGPACFQQLITLEELDQWLPRADLVACCMPQTPETVGLLGKERLLSMKTDAVLINVGRGTLIDTESLVDVLQLGRLWGVGLDVTDPEPLPPEHPLWRFDRVLITPHVSGIGFGHQPQTSERIWERALKNLEHYLYGRPPENLISPNRGY